MEFDRNERAKSILTAVVATFIREESNPNPLITVTNLSVSPSGREMTVFFTTIPEAGENDALIFLKRKGSELRDYIKKNARVQHIPNISFAIDYGERHRQHIDEITQNIEKDKEN